MKVFVWLFYRLWRMLSEGSYDNEKATVTDFICILYIFYVFFVNYESSTELPCTEQNIFDY